MHEEHQVEMDLKKIATQVSAQLGGASVVIIAAGSANHDLPRTMTASSLEGEDVRLRDLLGILEVSKQIETLKHLNVRASR